MKRHAKIDETCRCCWICGKRGGMGATLLLSMMGYDVALVPNSRATDLEDMGYAVAGADLCAAGVGAPHIRQRLYWVADARRTRLRGSAASGQTEGPRPAVAGSGDIGRMVNADQPGSQGRGLRSDGDAGIFPLAHGIPNRLGRLRGYGNAIVPQVAAQFIGAVMECKP